MAGEMEYQKMHAWIIEFILFLLHLEITECQARFYGMCVWVFFNVIKHDMNFTYL